MSAVARGIGVGLLGVVLGSGLAWAGNEVGDVATDFTLPDGNGVDYTLYDYQGDIIMIVFWDPW